MGSDDSIIAIEDFSGGLNTTDSEYTLPLNQSPDLQNINLLDKAFTKRRGDTAFNSSAMVSSATPGMGGGYVKFSSGTEFITAVYGTKFFTSSALTGVMADATGVVTITSGTNNIWTPLTYGDLQIWFGGAPDAPFKYSGTGNAAALGGTPPSAYTGFVANNRVFAISTSANQSRIYWPVLSNPEDWTGTGSGNADVSANDGEALQCGIVLGVDRAILFKNTSTHLMALTRQPFPIYQLQKGVGIAGRYAYAMVEGVIYFITPGKRMLWTSDGVNFEPAPNDINDIFDSINSSRVANIQGVYYQALRQIHWYVSTGISSTNNLCIIWDLRRKCFLKHPTGYKVNTPFIVQGRRLFGCHNDGKIYEKDVASTFTDASEASPYAIDAYWRIPFCGKKGFSSTVHPLYVDFSCLSEASAVLEASYGYDFSSNRATQNFSIIASGAIWDSSQFDVGVWGGQTSVIRRQYVTGRGNLFSWKIRNSTPSQGFTFQGATVQLSTARGRKVFTAV
jgi:hypothetical protein